MKLSKILAGAALVIPFALFATPAQAQESYIGQAILMGSNYCPNGTIEANGQVMPIRGNEALFSLYGRTYGGDGSTTFGLPKIPPPVPGMRYCIVLQGNYPPRP